MFTLGFKKIALGDNHLDGSEFNRTDDGSPAYNGNPYSKPANPLTNSLDKKPKKGAEALSVALGMSKVSAELDDTAKGVSEGLDKEYNGTNPVQNLEDTAASKSIFKKHLAAKRNKPCL